MKRTVIFSSLIMSLILGFATNVSAGNSGKITFTGSIVRGPCAMNIVDVQFDATSQQVKAVPLNIDFSGCDLTPDEINVSVRDVSTRNSSKDVSFKLIENSNKLVEMENGQKDYRPMQLSGNYMPNGNANAAKLIVVEYQ